ncbi:MAG: ATP-binding protein [Terracidiphilus sp.]|nr:ATP-binding protein [Terracidiphilus sp.]
MRGLFFKIFIIFWIAQSLIFVISTALIVRHHFESPDILFDTLASGLRLQARDAAAAYEQGGCAAVEKYGKSIGQTVALGTAAGAKLCWPQGMVHPGTSETRQPSKPERHPNQIPGFQIGNQYVWAVPTTADNGNAYVFFLSRPHVPWKPSLFHDLMHFSSPQLPVAIVICGLTTFVLVLLIMRPVVQLRRAARSLSIGKLNTRVKLAGAEAVFFAGDEIEALVHDFNYMAERLEQLVAAQKLLLRDVSHELRSPLARLSVALELAREDSGDVMIPHLDRIEREADRLNQLIGQLLTLSSMEALERQKHFQPVVLSHLIQKMIPDTEYEARQRNCSVLFLRETECTVLGNQELLYRAIENILRNAIRYTATGTQVEIALRDATVHGERMAEIAVSDHGPGIPEDQQEAIFRPFYRVDDARSPDTGGFGVGLAIAERTVRLHLGEITAENRSGGGATLRIRIAVVAEPRA